MNSLDRLRTLLRKARTVFIEIPTIHFVSGYQRGGKKPKKRENYPKYSFVVTDWQAVRRRAEAYWKAIWHLIGWFLGTLLPASTIMRFLAFGTILAWILAIMAAVVYLGIVLWHAMVWTVS